MPPLPFPFFIFFFRSKNKKISKHFVLARKGVKYENQLLSELPTISVEAFLAISVALLVAFSNIDVIPILSAPFRTPSKKVSHPRPIMARKTMATTINTRMPIAQILFSSVSLTIMKGNYLLLV
jgi:hypothetical protein